MQAVIVQIIIIFLYMAHKILNVDASIVIKITILKINLVNLVLVRNFYHYNLVHVNLNIVSINKRIKGKNNYSQKDKICIKF